MIHFKFTLTETFSSNVEALLMRINSGKYQKVASDFFNKVERFVQRMILFMYNSTGFILEKIKIMFECMTSMLLEK